MKYYPIIFNSEMVRAILDGRKTQTRRLRGLEALNERPAIWEILHQGYGFYEFRDKMRLATDVLIKCPYGQRGNKLWCITFKELFNQNLSDYMAGDDGNIYRIKDGVSKKIKPSLGGYKKQYYQVKIGRGQWRKNYYVHRLICSAFYGIGSHPLPEIRHLDGNSLNNRPENLDRGTPKQNASDRFYHGKPTRGILTKEQIEYIKSRKWGTWKDMPKLVKKFGVKGKTIESIIYKRRHIKIPKQEPPNFPRWASRITLEITDVRVERLQEITSDDAKAEGVHPVIMKRGYRKQPLYTLAFIELWSSIHKKEHTWQDNPWVWVITFTKVA